MSLPAGQIGSLLTELAQSCDVGAALVDSQRRYLFVNQALADMLSVSPEECVGRAVHDLAPELASTTASHHSAAIERGETTVQVTVRGELNGRPGAWLASYYPLELGHQRIVGIVVTDISAQADAEDRAERRAQQQMALAAVSRRALAGDALPVLYDDVVSMLATTLGGDLPVILERALDGGYVLRAGRGWPDGAVGVLRFEQLWTGAGDTADAAYREHGVAGGVLTPLGAPDAPWGAVGVLSTSAWAPADEDVAFVEGVAHLVQVTHDRLRDTDELRRLADQRARLVAEALDAADIEREHVSEVLHDDALQALLVARQELADADADPKALGAARRALDECVLALRRAVREIHPVVREHAGLGPALRALTSGNEDRYGFCASVDVGVHHGGRHERLVLALARELLTNAGKHADAANVAVVVREDGGEIVLEVTDDGCGIPPHTLASAIERGHVGLASCVHRAQAAGGTAVIAARDDGGTRAVVRLPL